MASITKQKPGRWRVQVRRNGQAASETFLRRADAKRWAAEAERQIERGAPPVSLTGRAAARRVGEAASLDRWGDWS